LQLLALLQASLSTCFKWTPLVILLLSWSCIIVLKGKSQLQMKSMKWITLNFLQTIISKESGGYCTMIYFYTKNSFYITLCKFISKIYTPSSCKCKCKLQNVHNIKCKCKKIGI
jgi:hypothetical protein